MSSRGIVWRLWLHSQEYASDAELSLLRGPSDDALYRGCTLAAQGEQLCDDVLGEQEMDLICGVYKVSTSELYLCSFDRLFLLLHITEQGVQTADLLWWPKQGTFLRSGLWVGYWMPWCETWFQNRLEKIARKEADLRSSRQWDKALTFQIRKTGKIYRANTADSASYITEQLV